MKLIKILILALLLYNGSFCAQNFGNKQTENNPYKKTKSISNDTVKIFFLGNSFLGTNNLPGIVEDLANLGGFPYIIDSHTPGGQYSTHHIQNPFVFEKFQEQAWDYIVIQDNQGAYVNMPPYISSEYLNANLQLYDSIKEYNSCTRVLWFAGWGGEGGYPTYFPGDNTISCIGRILDNMIYQNTFVNEIVAPVGEAWIKSLTEQAGIDLYSADAVHPSQAGSVVSASVLYSIIFKSNPGNLSFTGGLPAADAEYLLQCGYDVVIDTNNFAEYNIEMYSPQISFFNNIVQVPDIYTFYLWLKDNAPISSASIPGLEFQGSGNYSVIVTDQNGCQQKSFETYLEEGPTAKFSYTVNDTIVEFINESTNADVYVWNFGDGQTSTEENPIHEFSGLGQYSIILTAWNQYGGADFTDTINFEVNAIELSNKPEKLLLFPNPAKTLFYLKNVTNKNIYGIKIFDLKGELIISRNEIILPSKKFQIDLSNLKSGLYFVRYDSEQSTHAQKLIVF